MPNAEQLTAHGIETLAEAPEYHNPRDHADGGAVGGVLLFKPETIVRADVLVDVALRAAECGYIVSAGRQVKTEEVRRRQLVRRHYHAHWEIARRGQLLPQERLRMLQIYDRSDFEAITGRGVFDIPVVPALADPFAEHADALAAWSETETERHGLNSGGLNGPYEVGDLTYVHLHPAWRDAGPIFFLNPHMPTVTGWFERASRPLTALLLRVASERALPWARVRAEFCGAGIPARAAVGSLRRDMWDGVFPLRYGAGVRMSPATNGVHLSNGPVEALREAHIWFGLSAEEAGLAGLLAGCGVAFSDVLECAYVTAGGQTKILADLTRGMTVDEARNVIRAGALSAVADQPDNAETLRRVDLAYEATKAIRHDPELTAAFVGGSVARNRASHDSDLDLMLVTHGASHSGLTDRRTANDVVVESTWFTAEEALEQAACAKDASMAALRRSGRWGTALAIFDRTDLTEALRAAAATATPDLAMLARRVDCMRAAVSDLRAGDVAQPEACDRLRTVFDNSAVLLLTLSPMRYQKPKWVVADLTDAGHRELVNALLVANNVAGTATAASAAVDRSATFVEGIAHALGLPPFDTVRELGLMEDYPEYSYLCQCVDDARSLLADGFYADAEYASAFNARMALTFLEPAARRGHPVPWRESDEKLDVSALMAEAAAALDRCSARIAAAA